MSDQEKLVEWAIERADDIKQIEELIKAGHHRHCACRQVWGDGECDLIKAGYDPDAWMRKEG